MRRFLLIFASVVLVGPAHGVTVDMDAICAALKPGEHVDVRGTRFERGDGRKCSAKNLSAGWPVEDNSDHIVGRVRP